jgi:hypothetical protein
MSQNHRPAAPAIDPTKKSSLFEVPLSIVASLRQEWPFAGERQRITQRGAMARRHANLGLTELAVRAQFLECACLWHF